MPRKGLISTSQGHPDNALLSGWLKSMERYGLRVLEAGSPRSGVGRAVLPLQAPGSVSSRPFP